MREPEHDLGPIIKEAEAFLNRTEHPTKERRFQVSFEWDWWQWMFGVLWDPNVIYTGESGVCWAWDANFFLLFLGIEVRWVRHVRPYGSQSVGDAFFLGPDKRKAGDAQ